MTEGKRAFDRVLVPLEFVAADLKLIEAGAAIEAGGQHLDLPEAVQRTMALGASLTAGGGKVRFVHATPSLAYAGIYGGPEGAWMPATTLKELDEQAQRTSMKIMRDLARRYCPGATVEFAAPAGSANDVILAEAESFHADLIVLATSGRGRTRRLFLGSTADKIIRQAPCPVLVVPGEHEHHEG